MVSQPQHSARHTVPVAAPAGVVYGLLADAPRWPVLLPWFVHVERVDFDGARDSLMLWYLHEGQVRSARARRRLHPGERRIDFEVTEPLLPGPPTHGSWNVSPEDGGRCLLTLRQERPAGPGPAPGALGAQVREQLAAVREAAERWERWDELLLSFEDSVHVLGSPEIVYDFLYRIADWADLVPHVERAEVGEDRPGVQRAVLHTSDPGSGDTSVVEVVRLCFPAAGRIVHQQTAGPGLLAAHYGEWSLEPDARGVRVVRTHQVMLRESALEPALGAGAQPVDARRHVREWLGRTGTETLTLARWHAESALRRLR
ncbi:MULTISPECIES: SRPBCC family protein [unclassified Streptomyces]|uniref:SRPBCC family protein n=1 Tax=unclassified Streptomyces TaxID=2593676 RepID=UPI0033A5D735